jgi:HEAT repeat protein
MKFCNQCGTRNTGNAKFCQECGNSLHSLVASPAATPAPSAAAAYRLDAAASPLLNLSHCVSQARSRLKEIKQLIPPASSEAVAPLMGRLQTIAPDDSTARIELIEALGRTRDPVVLRALLLVAGAGSKHVRRAVAVALSGINHTLSAYILLPMLDDQSSRVRNSAIQALIYINQPHTAESIISACLGNRELKRIAFDTVQRLRPIQRDSFIHSLSQVNPAGSVSAAELVREFRRVVGSLPSAGPANAVDHSSQPVRSSQESVNSDFRASGATHVPAPVQRTPFSEAAQENSRRPEIPIFEPAQPFAEQLPERDRKQPAADLVAAAEDQSVRKVHADSEFEIPVPSLVQENSGVRANEEITSRPMSPLPAEAQANPASSNMNGGSAAARRFADAPPARISQTSDDFVNHGIDVSSLDDWAVSRLMSELVPETPGVRSNDSVADFRFFESVSTNLNDSHAGWQSPEDSVFEYDPAPEVGFSDTQSFSTQSTNRSDFEFTPNAVPSSFGSSASGRVPQVNTAGSSASWNVQPPLTPLESSPGSLRPMNPYAGDHSRSGSHFFHPPQSLPAPPVGPGWPPAPQNQAGPIYQGPQAFQGGMQPQIPGMSPQHFMPMPPQMAMPPASFPMPHMPAQAFSPMGTDPTIPLMNRSAEMSTFGQQNLMAASVAGSLSQPEVATAAPLSEDVLLNGGTMLEIPMLPAAGTTVATTDAQSSAPIELTVSTTVQPDDSEKAAKKAQGERNLERLRQARDHAFHALLENPEAISGAVPRLISKKITTLLTTPAGDHAQIKQQLVALGKTGSPHVLETLASFCQKPVKEIRVSCAEALGLVKHQGSVVQLLKFLGDKSGTVIETALKSMIGVQDKAIYPVILAAGLVNSSLRTIVSSSIETVGEEFKPAWEQQLLSCLALNDPDLVAFSLPLLVKLTGATHVDSFMSFAENKDSIIRAAAIEALVKTGAKKVIGTINEALEDQDPLVRAQAATAVGTMHSPRSIDLLGKLLLDSNLSVRRSAAQSAAKIEELDLGDAIVSALKVETDHLVIEYLLEALNKNGGNNAYSLLVQFVEGTDSELRELALKALRKLKLQESVPVFTRLLDDKHPHIRKQAIEQLALLKTSGAIPRLKQMVKADTDEHVRGACARALGDLQDKTSLDLLEAALEDHAVVRFQAVIALGKLGHQAAGPVLLDLLRDPQPEIRYQAVRAIGQLKLEGIEERIETLFQDTDEMVRRGAEQTLQELGMTVSQIRSRRNKRRFVSILLKLSPALVVGAIPGRSISLLVITLLVASAGAFWGIGSMVSHAGGAGGGEDLPVTSVIGVAVSPKTQHAFVLRARNILDIWSLADTTLVSRFNVPPGTTQIIPEANGNLLIVHPADGIRQLDPKAGFSPDSAKLAAFEGPAAAVFLEIHSNSLCLFENAAAGSQLRVLDAATLQVKSKITLPTPFKGSCIVSPDLKVAAMLESNGDLTLVDTATLKVAKTNVAKMAKVPSLDVVSTIQFSSDMKYFCFGGPKGFFALKMGNMSLVKHFNEAGSCGFIQAKAGGSVVLALAGQSLLEFKDEFKTMSTVPVPSLSTFNYLDPEGKLIISAAEEEKEVRVFNLQDKTTVQIPPSE